MRPADRAFLLLAVGVCAFALCFVDAARLRMAAGPDAAERMRLVAQLRLTDLALFTEARYTRHPSQADLHSAFQDHPLALEHFPTGSLIAPPAGLAKVMPPGTPEAVSLADGAGDTAK
ncbi:MAG: hypothetical protein IT510_00720 [Sulfuritalea sp.]|jgi:hypothetical protein|nr:hypothetical protein [Sulfuritalea sp.]